MNKESSITNFKTDNFTIKKEELEKIQKTCKNLKIIENIDECSKIMKDLAKIFKAKDEYLKKSYWSYKEEQETKKEIRERIKRILYTLEFYLNKMKYKLSLKENSINIYFKIEALNETIYLRLREKSHLIDNPKEDKYEKKIPIPNKELEIAEMEENWQGLKYNSVIAVDKKVSKIDTNLGEVLEKILLLLLKEKDLKIERKKAQDKKIEKQNELFEKRKRKKQEEEKFEKLKKDAQNFKIANNIREYLKNYEKKKEDSEEEREYIEWAYKKADWLDPLTEQKDEILDELIDLWYY